MLKTVLYLIILNILFVVSYFQGFLDAKGETIPYWSRIAVFIVGAFVVGGLASRFFKFGYQQGNEDRE